MICISCLCALGLLGSGTLVDRIVAVVDKQVLTQSELLIEARVALVLQEGEAAGSADLDEGMLSAFLDYVVNQILIATQARRLGAADVEGAETERAVQRFAQRFRSVDAYRAFLRRFDISDEALRNILERDLRNERFIADRMRLIGATGEGSSDPDSPRYRSALKRWLGELRDAAELRVIGPSGELELQPRRAAAAAGDVSAP